MKRLLNSKKVNFQKHGSINKTVFLKGDQKHLDLAYVFLLLARQNPTWVILKKKKSFDKVLGVLRASFFPVRLYSWRVVVIEVVVLAGVR